MVELNIPLILDVIRTAGIIVGIIYYLAILRNQQKARMIDMVSRRATQALSYEYQKMVRQIIPMYSGWSTPDEYYQQYNYEDTPELEIARVITMNTLNLWGFLYREGMIGVNFIDRLYSPWHIINTWETFKPLMLDERETMGNPEAFKDFEYLYNAMKKKYPNLNAETRFWYNKWRDENN